MRITHKILASVLAACMLTSTAAIGGFAATAEGIVGENEDTYYSNKAKAVDTQYAYNGDDLGATYTPERTTFKVWAPAAKSVTLNRYATGSDNETGAADLGTVEMEKMMKDDAWTGVWQATVEGNIVNTYYTYTVTTNRIGGPKKTFTTNETQDVYSRAVGVNGRRSMVVDLDSTDPEGWENDRHVVVDKPTDSTVWEIHVKDFSYDPDSGVSEPNRGKYLAFTETGTTLGGEGNISTCIDYLKNLGITTVQINPFYDFQSIDEAGDPDQFNWGYDPQNYNVPEGSYSSDPFDGNVRIRECKQMIQALHNAGFSVVMDVVYNHTFSCSEADSCFQATVPNYYYRLTSSGTFSSGSGCGNDVACERAMVHKYIVESCRYWVDEYHVDGFRFDLMGLMDAETINAVRSSLDQVDPRLTMWGEGWAMGTSSSSTTSTGQPYIAATQANSAYISERVGFFNDSIRDGIKGSVWDASDPGFTGNRPKCAPQICYGVQANTDAASSGWVAQAPSQTVTYADCHDNMTLYDQIMSANQLGDFGVRSDDAIAINRLAATIIYTSQGVAFTLAGQEMARTKGGDHNSYKSPADVNMIDWSNLVDYADLVSYYEGLMNIRKNFAPFTEDDNSYSAAYNFFNEKSANTATVAFTVSNDTAGQWQNMLVIYNASKSEAEVSLATAPAGDWVIICDGKEAGVKNLGEISGDTYTAAPCSGIIAVDKASFESVGLESDTGDVTVNYVYQNGSPMKTLDGKEIAPMSIHGKIGTGYQTAPSAAVPNIYMVNEIIGDPSGVYSETPKTVTYVYVDYVPDSIRNFGDLNKDGKINIIDVTMLQKRIANLITFDEETEAGADFNYDGDVNTNDVTMLQKYIAKYAVSLGEVLVKYFVTDENGNTTPIEGNETYTIKGRVGDDYTVPEYKAMGFENDPEHPAELAGKIPYGFKKVVELYYLKGELKVKLHLKHQGTLTWAPHLWIWGADFEGKDIVPALNFTGGSWPGKQAADEDGDGWFDYSFDFEGKGTYNVIVSKSGSPQSKDYKGFMANEMWIIIRDDDISSGDFLTFYGADPEVNPDAPVITGLFS